MPRENKNIDSDKNKNANITTKKRKKKKKRKVALRVTLLVILMALIIIGGPVVGMVIGIAKSAPEIDPANASATLSESSVIVDENGNLIEQIHDPNENREIVKLSDIPEHLQKAFIAIEDQRYDKHFGVDILRIMGSLLHNVKVGDPTSQGASTITQQLVKNLYLTNEKSWERKIKEVYLAIQVERKLSKDQILENYLNTIPLGQSSYGVQTAAQTYFSKDVSELTLGESALLAGAAKSTVYYAPFNRYNLEDIDDIPEENIVGYVYIGSVQYACVYNQNAIDRQHVILDKMLDLKFITQEEHDAAMAEDMHVALKPGQTKVEGISSTPMDYVKEKVIEDLAVSQNLSYEEAENFLYKGGLTVTTTIDVNMQKSLDESYDNFPALFLGAEPTGSKPVGQDWRYFKWSGGQGYGTLDSALNILNENGQIIYYAKDNIMDENNNIYLNNEEYSFDKNGDLIIKSDKFDIHSSAIDVVDTYTIDDKLNFVSHNIGALNIGENYEVMEQSGTKGTFKIPKNYLDKNPEVFSVGNDNVLRIQEGCFFFHEKGIVQPQSATVIMDYHTGKIKAMIGGRNIEGSKTFNRAADAARQPGSTIKPLSVYTPALDMGYSAAYIIDDVPRYNGKGDRWPKNWYENREIKYWGLTTLRESIEQSINTNAVTMLETIGTDSSINLLSKFGLVNFDNPEDDTFILSDEDSGHNDVNLASLALGGLTKGFTPLGMTAAYGAIANDGVYIEPIAYTTVVNNKGETIMENIPETHVVVSPEVASLMKDILKTTVTNGLSYRAKLPSEMGIDVAGKTGTTQANGDFWFMGFTPYYVGGIWVGNDNVQMKLSGDSGANARLWSGIMTPIHQGLPPAKFERNPNLIPVQVCKQSGKLPSSLCSRDQRGSQIITEYFVPGTQPTETCDTHVEAEVCTASNMLKSPYCPGDSIGKRVFINRKTNYNPEAGSSNYEARTLYQQVLEDKVTFSIEELKQIYTGQVEFDDNGQITKVLGVPVANLTFKGYLTSDYQYQVPSKTCTYHTNGHHDKGDNEEDNEDKEKDNDNEDDDKSNDKDDDKDDKKDDKKGRDKHKKPNTDDIIDDNNGNGNSDDGNNGNDQGTILDDIIDSIGD